MTKFLAQMAQIAAEIRQIVETEEAYLNSLDKMAVSSRRNRQARSTKQIVGHMVDSASNNLHRLIHLQYSPTPLVFPNYSTDGNNDRWIAIQNYQDEDWHTLVQLWKYSNLHVAHSIEHADPAAAGNRWIAAPGEEVSLADMIFDYPRHLRLHLGEIRELHDKPEC